MQAFIKEDKIIINTQILDNEKPELQKFIEKAETPFVSATTLYDIEGNPAGLAFKNVEDSVLDTSVDMEVAAFSNDIRLGKVAFTNGERIEGTSVLKIPDKISFYGNPTMTEISEDLASADWSEYCNTRNVTNGNIGLFSDCSKLKIAKSLNNFRPTDISYYCTNDMLLTTVEPIDTSRCTAFTQAFQMCSNLEHLPVFDMSSARISGLYRVIINCGKLSDQSLHNIVKSLCDVKYNSSWSTSFNLDYVGFNSTQINKVIKMPEWAELQKKGWTTGL